MFEFTPEQKDIQKAAREFAEGEFRQVARELDEKEQFDDRLWKKAAELGFVGVFVGEKYGGPGYGYIEQCLIIEEFARVDGGITHAIDSTFFGAHLINLVGSEEQKKKFFPAICNGQLRMSVAITEADAGSDVASITTTAIKDGDHYVITGSKMFASAASVTDLVIVLCVTNPEAARKYDRFSTILVETKRPGYEANRLKGKLSLRCSETCEVALNHVSVPKENLVGEEGKGFYNIMEFLNRTRVQTGAFGVGTAQGALDKAIMHARQRRQFGSPIGSFQLIQAKIADMATLVEAARSFLYRAASMLDRGEIDPGLNAMVKLFTAEVAVKVADEAIQIHGGYGILKEYDVEHYWRDAKVLEIFEGAKEIDKLIIGRRILKV